ncbi:MAG1360 family OppF-related protein [Mycoplasmopsis agassizii]|uniref:ABC transporter ATP-binding protein n=1 Tax=Mycoplasmopsis agassizii TaxID=33922 RepID=A0ABX4H4X3_9BACT|nr:hypothetical protein [Mycoplasmopsis agassizii]PAF54945.1 hypothetical protein CJF60_04380 [Mycoplasmopsis agassizii]SMC17025.1 hypothetical protein SAMN02745179_00376 [Mycoplasmopsis agassizii]
MNKKIYIENLTYFDTGHNKKPIKKISRLETKSGEFNVLVGDEDLEILKNKSLLNKFKGSSFFIDENFNFVNLLKNPKTEIAFLEDSEIYKLADDDLIINHFLSNARKTKWSWSRFLTLTKLAKNHRKLFAKKYIMVFNDLNKNISDAIALSVEFNSKHDFTRKIDPVLFKGFVEKVYDTRIELLLNILNSINNYWQFYSRIKSISNKDLLVVDGQKIENYKEKLEELKKISKINRSYIAKLEEINRLKTNFQLEKKNFLFNLKISETQFIKYLKTIKNNYKVYWKIWQTESKITYLKLALIHKHFYLFLKSEMSDLMHLPGNEFNDLKVNVYEYIYEFINNNLFNLKPEDVTVEKIKKIIKEEFDFQIIKSYVSIAKSNIRNMNFEKKEFKRKLKEVKSHKVKKYEKNYIGKDLNTIEYQLTSEMIDFEWKKEFLKDKEFVYEDVNHVSKKYLTLVKKYKSEISKTNRNIQSCLYKNSELNNWFTTNEKAIKIKKLELLINEFFAIASSGKKLFRIQSKALNLRHFKQLALLENVLTATGQFAIPISDLLSTIKSLTPLKREKIAFVETSLNARPFLFISRNYSQKFNHEEQKHIFEFIKKFIQKNNFGFILVDKTSELLKKHANNLFINYENKTIEIGDYREVIKNPIHPYSKYLIANLAVKKDLIKTGETVINSGEIPSFHSFKDNHKVFSTLDEFITWSKIDATKVINYVPKEIIHLTYGNGEKTQMVDLKNADVIEETVLVDI